MSHVDRILGDSNVQRAQLALDMLEILAVDSRNVRAVRYIVDRLAELEPDTEFDMAIRGDIMQDSRSGFKDLEVAVQDYAESLTDPNNGLDITVDATYVIVLQMAIIGYLDGLGQLEANVDTVDHFTEFGRAEILDLAKDRRV